MTNHVDLPDSELHEPKGLAGLTGGASDIGKVVVSDGAGGSVARKLLLNDIDDYQAIPFTGTYFNDNMTSAIVDTQVEGKLSYMIGAGPTQVVQLKLPDPATFPNALIILKRLDNNHGDGSAVKFIPFNTDLIEGAAELAITLQNVAVTLASNGVDWYIVNDVYTEKFKHGWFNYDDAATAGAPINHVGGVDTKLTNDTLGAATITTHAPEGVSLVWDPSTNQFDWTSLLNGDTTDHRIDVEVTTTTANQEVFIYFLLGVGGTTINVPVAKRVVKTAGVERIVEYTSIFMGNDNTRLNPAELYVSSPNNCTVIVNGWYSRVLGKKSTY